MTLTEMFQHSKEEHLKYKNYSASINRFSLMASDLLAMTGAFIFSWWIESIRTDVPFSLVFKSGSDTARAWSFLVIVLVTCLWSWGHLRHYTYRKPFWNELKETLLMLIGLAIADLAIVAISKWSFSRHQWAIFWLVTIFALPLCRWLTKLLLIKLKTWSMPTIIIGSEDNARDAYLAVCSEKFLGFGVIGFVAPNDNCSTSPVSTLPLFHITPEQLLEKYHQYKIFIALEYEQHELQGEWLRYLSAHGVRNISIVPTLRGVPLYSTNMSHFFSHELLMLRVKNNLAKRSSIILKRTFDIVVSSLLLILLSPLFLFIGWKVSRDGTSPFYGHERIGQGGRRFKCLKFRSMISNSAEVLENLLKTDQNALAEWQKDFKLKNDPRITSIGHFLRKTSLDELPQLVNVLKGEMSLVGPRPIVQEELERYGDDKSYYLMAKPGMTGLWQVSGRNDVDYATRVYLDSWYVKNWALWNDIAILFKTVNVVLKRDGAY